MKVHSFRCSIRINLCERARAAEVFEMNVFSNRDGDFLRIELGGIRIYIEGWDYQINKQLRITARRLRE